MYTFKLEPVRQPETASPPSGWDGLSSDVLLQDARWFTHIRWAVACVFAAFGAATNLAPDFLVSIGIRPPTRWPWLLAGVAVLINLVIIAWLRRMSETSTRTRVEACIWAQIALDLSALTGLVYLVGPVDTVIPFAYLFHIALACIFFGRRKSFLVVLLSTLLYLSVVVLEIAGLLPSHTVLVRAWAATPDWLSLSTMAVPTVFVWFVVWYLVSTISEEVRLRDRDLDGANVRLLKADEEKNLQILRVTHDLKAPFVGIESNIQMLRMSYWDRLSEEVRDLICRIEARGATLRARIGDILTLGKLRSSAGAATPVTARVPLRELLETVVQEVQALADQRHVSIALKATEASVLSDARQLKILFLNLLTNAITYSPPEGGTVEVGARGGATVRVRVTDHGMGISENALPHIFEDYYRSKEAAQVNSLSTGLGLAIVRQIAQNLKLTLIVNSTVGKGTTFQVVFPPERRMRHGEDPNHR